MAGEGRGAAGRDGPAPETVRRIRDLLDRGRSRSAWELARAEPPLASWLDAEAATVAGRLASFLGDPRLGETIHLRNHRRHPEDDVAFYYALQRRTERRGPAEVLRTLEERLASRQDMLPGHRADLLGLLAMTLAHLHDFDAAHRAMDAATSLQPDNAWQHFQRSVVLALEDRTEEAADAARTAMLREPGRVAPPAQLATCLVHLHRDDDAIAVLEEAHRSGESGLFAAQLHVLLSERDEYARALDYLDQHVQRSPLLNRKGRSWVAGCRSDLHYLLGDRVRSMELAAAVTDSRFHERVFARLREPGAFDRERRRLDVPFIRQHHMTCGPATLASLAACWGQHFDHLAIAEEICYDGTPWHKARAWAEARGFLATEFRLTHDVLVALIGRGVPFALTTEDTTAAHLQACIGFDDCRGTVLLRDPTERHHVEADLEGLIELHPVQGPRCMLLLPESEAPRIEGIDLPDAAAFDSLHRLGLALDSHRREEARAVLDAMTPGHPLTLWAQGRLASHDGNAAAEYQAFDALAERFPDCAPLRYARLMVLQRHPDPARREALLRAELRRHPIDPVFHAEMGDFLLQDFRQLSQADQHLRQAVRQRPRTGRVYVSLADCRWKQGRREEAVRLRRIAACLEDKHEFLARAYAAGCRALSRPEEALEFLERRTARLGALSAGPWITLAEEHDQQNRTEQARAVLERALCARPQDGELMLAAGRLRIRWGDHRQGRELMAAAEGRVREDQWLHQTAEMEEFLGNRAEAIARYRRLVALAPYSAAFHESLAHLLAEERGEAAALALLRDATTRCPGSPNLWKLRAQWEQRSGPRAAIECLERLRSLDPGSAWALRELALRQLDAGEPERAREAAEQALAREPTAADSHAVLAQVRERAGQRDLAHAAYRDAVRQDVDHEPAAEGVLRTARGQDAILDSLEFLRDELRRQVSDGSIVPLYRELAHPHLDPEVLADQLRELCEARPDLWQTWSARLRQALDLDHQAEAERCAEELTNRFPDLAPAWLERAEVHKAAGRREEQVAALRTAVQRAPTWIVAVTQLAEALERLEQFDQAQEVLERALHHRPLEGPAHGFLADLLWKRGRRAEAFERLLEGVGRCPDYRWAWSRLAEWAGVLGRKPEVEHALATHRESRGHLPGWWREWAGVLRELGRSAQALAVVDEGLRRHPDHLDLAEPRASILVALHRYQEALDTCDEALGRDPDHTDLQGCRAWVLMQAGRPQEAIRSMQGLVQRRPDYLMGMHLLARWLGERERWPELKEVATRMLRQDPRLPQAHLHLATAASGMGDRSALKDSLRQSFELDPAQDHVGCNLLDLHLEDGERDAAAQVLRILKHHLPGAATRAAALRFAVARQDREGALAEFHQLLQLPEADGETLEEAGELLQQAGWRRDRREALEAAAFGEERPAQAVLEAWALALRPGREWTAAARRLDRMRSADEELAARGWAALLQRVHGPPDQKTLHGWIQERGDWFRSRTELWLATAEALGTVQDSIGMVTWMEDWQDREADLSVDVLFNFAVALEETGDRDLAHDIRRKALAREPGGSYSGSLRSVLALDHALARRTEEARAHGEEVEPDTLSPHYRGCHDLYRSLTAAATGDHRAAELAYADALETFRGHAYDDAVRHSFDRAAEVLADHVPEADGRPGWIQRHWGRYRGVKAESSSLHRLMVIAAIYLVLRYLTSLL